MTTTAYFFGRVRNIEESNNYQLRHACLSVRLSVLLHVAARLPLEVFWLSLMFGDFSKTLRENSNLIKI